MNICKFCMFSLLFSFTVCQLAYAEIAPSSDAIFVFISSSMPKTSLLQWMQEAKSIHATLVIRGLINHSLPETKVWIGSLIRNLPDQEGGIAIDPPLFRLFAIDKVPTVVVSQPFERCFSAQCAPVIYDKVSGNISFKAALRELSERGTASAEIAERALETLS